MGLFMGGLFNIGLFGLPIYIWCWLGTLALAGIMYVLLYFALWKPMDPLKGVFFAQKHDTNVSLILDKYGAGEMVAENEAKCLIDVEDPNEVEIPDKYRRLEEIPETPLEAILRKYTGKNRTVKFVERVGGCPLERSANVRVQGVRCDLIVDSDNWTIKTSPQHKAILRTIEQYNEQNENDQIFTYKKFWDRIAEGKIACPKEIHPVEVINWSRIDAEFPLYITEASYAGKKRELATVIQDAGKEWIRELCKYVFIGGILVAFMIIAVRLLTHYV